MAKLEKDIIVLKNEILNLKVAKKKIASQLRTVQYTVPVELTVASSYRSTQMALITLTPYNNTVPLLAYSVDISSMDDRELWYVGGRKEDGTFEYEFYLTLTENPSDTPGKKLNYDLVFTSTSQMDIEVNYKDM